MPIEIYSNPTQLSEFPIKSGETIANGSLVTIKVSTGELQAFAEGSDYRIAGIATGWANTGYALLYSGLRLRSAVVGVTGITDIGKNVYATSATALSLTPPNAVTSLPIGKILYWVSSTIVIWQLYEYTAKRKNREMIYLATVNSKTLEGTSALVLATRTMEQAGKVLKLILVPNCKDAGVVAGSQTLKLQIGGADVTGGSAVITKDSAIGTEIEGTCTAANTFAISSSLTLNLVASGTGFTADKMTLISVFALIEIE